MDKGSCYFNSRDVALALYQSYFNPLSPLVYLICTSKVRSKMPLQELHFSKVVGL